jgi:tetratricopeptide (TPR) repeat protein
MSRFRYSNAGLVILLVAMFFGSATAAFKHVHEGLKAPEIHGKDLLSGKKISTDDMVGEGAEAVIVVFWATWSPRSLELLKDMKDLVNDHPEHAVKVVAVNVEGQSISAASRKAIDQALDALALPFPVILDPDLGLFNAYGVIAIPSTAVLDREHILRSGPSGYSLMVQDAITDTVMALMGLREELAAEVLSVGYRPNNRALRYYNMAVQMTNKGLLERALDNAGKAASYDTMFSSPHSLSGLLLLEIGEGEKAEAAYSKAVELNGDSVVALTGWGHSLLELGRLEEAQVKLEAALSRDAAYTPTLLYLARCRQGQDDLAGAEKHLMAAMELNPRDPQVLYQLGSFYRVSGREEEALQAFKTAFEQLGY